MSGSRINKTLINTIVGMIARIVNLIMGLACRTVVLHVLGIQYAGVSGLFTSILTILSLAELGIGSAISFELYKPLSENNQKKIAALMHFYKMAYRLVALVVLVIGVCLIPFLNVIIKDVPDIKEDIVLIYIIYILKTVLSYLFIYKSTLLIANQQSHILSGIHSKMSLIGTTVECIILLMSKNYVLYLVSGIVVGILQNFWVSLKVDKQYPEIKLLTNERLTREEIKKLLLDIKGLATYKASFALGAGVDNVIISAYVSTAAVGLVSNYTMIRRELELLLKQFYNAVIPSVGNFAVTESENRQHELFLKLTFLNFWLSCFCSVSYLVIIQPFIIMWIGENYLLSFAIVMAIAFDFYLNCMLETVAAFRTATGVFVKGQYRPLIMVIINVVLSVILGSEMGIVGVLIATIASRLLTQWYDPYLLYRLIFKVSPIIFFKRYYSYMLVFVFCIMVSLWLAGMFEGNDMILNIIFRGIVCLIVPNLIIFMLYHKTEEFSYCWSKLKWVFNKIAKKTK